MEEARRGTEHHDANLRIAIFQREVEMSRFGRTEVRNLSFHPGVGVFALDVRADCGDEVAHLPDTAVRRAEVEAKLVGERGHLGQCNAEDPLTTGLHTITMEPLRAKVESPTLSQTSRQKWGTRSFL